MTATSANLVSLQALRNIDGLCNQYEKQLTDGCQPAVAEFLQRVSSVAERRYLFQELARLQLELRPHTRELVRVAWLREFPDLADLINGVLTQDFGPAAGTPSIHEPDLNTTVDHVIANSTANEAPTEYVHASGGRERFHILRSHARGGLGEVLLARDDALGRSVALKRIRRGQSHDAGTRERFLREAAITAALQHPGIVPVYSVGHTADGQPYYSMRFVEGRDLAACIGDFHRVGTPPKVLWQSLAFRQLLQRMISVCDTMHYAHDRGVIHRDLKPANIMIGDYGETLVVDWGLAKMIHGQTLPVAEQTVPRIGPVYDLTQQGSVVGTLAYMSPEQARADGEVGPSADVYSLGATFYHILSGKPPFTGTDAEAVHFRVLRGEFPRERIRGVPTPPPRHLLASLCAAAKGAVSVSGGHCPRHRALARE